MENSRRQFIKKSTIGAAGITIGGLGMSAKSYGKIIPPDVVYTNCDLL